MAWNGVELAIKHHISPDRRESAPNRIREWREKRGVSQGHLAELANTTPGQISKLERGDNRLTDDWLERLAEPLRCLPAELLPAHFYKPYLSKYESELLEFFRSLDDTDQVRLAKALKAWQETVTFSDISLVD